MQEPDQRETQAGAADDGVLMAPATAAASREEPAYRVFVGAQGLRAGWSILVFAAIFILLIATLQRVISQFVPRNSQAIPRPVTIIVAEGVTLLVIAIATFLMAKIERRSVLSYGFSGRSKAPYFIWGMLSGILALTALVAALKVAGLLVFDGQILHGLLAWEYALEWAAAFLLVALAEESLLRGYVQFTLARGIGFWWAALLLSVGFGLLHLGNRGESPVGIFSAAAIGLVCCLSLWLTKSLWWAVGMHASWDWAQSYLYGVADSGALVAGHLYATHPVGALLWSGGATGPEGSIYVLPVTLFIGAGVWLGFKPKSAETGAPLQKTT